MFIVKMINDLSLAVRQNNDISKKNFIKSIKYLQNRE